MLRPSPKFQLIASGFVMQGLRVVTTLVMARLISPSDYGAYVLVIALPGLIGAIGDFGIPTTLVQLKTASEQTIIHTATVLGAALYLIYGVITVGGGLYLSVVHNDWRLVGVAAIVAVTNLLMELYSIQLAVLNRRLDFRGEARQNLIASVSTGAAGVVFALSGLGVFAIALQGLFGQLVANAAVLRASPLSWPRHFSRAVAHEYFRLGGKVSLGLYVSNVQVNISNLVINHMGGKPIVGAWNRAQTITQLFGQNLLTSFDRVFYPLLCQAADDPERRRSIFVRSIFMLMLPSAFAAAWLIEGREAIVRLVLGAQWDKVPALLLVAALAVPAGALGSVGYRMAYAVGRTGLILRACVVDLILFAPVLAIVWRYGPVGIAAAWVFSKYLLAVLLLAGVWRQVAPPLGELLAGLAGIIGSAAVAGLAMTLLDRWLAAAWHDGPLYDWLAALWGSAPLLVRFIAVSSAALAVYGCVLYVVQREVVLSAWRLTRGPGKSAPPAAPTPLQSDAQAPAA